LKPGRILVHQAQRGEILMGQVGQTLPVHHADFDRGDAQGVTVGRAGGDGLMADHAAAAGAVDDIDRLAQFLFQQAGDDARGRIGAATRVPRNDQGDRTLGIGGQRDVRSQTEQSAGGHGRGGEQTDDGPSVHAFSPCRLFLFGIGAVPMVEQSARRVCAVVNSSRLELFSRRRCCPASA
jgi:hypothetical protein